jgi:hypothetical protein
MAFNRLRLYRRTITLFFLLAGLFTTAFAQAQPIKKSVSTSINESNPEGLFFHPPAAAKPGVLWMWMGTNMSKANITKDLELLKEEGFNRTTMFSLADVVNPWSAIIGKTPTPQYVSWTEPWWKLVRFAAQESKRLGMDFGMFNGSGYETSGGPWITPELSMQEIYFSKKQVSGNGQTTLQLETPVVDPRANMPFPVFNPENGLTEKPVIPGRKTFYKDIAVIALPANGIVAKNKVIDLTGSMQSDGKLNWTVPPGDWVIYRFGHTTMGALIQPAQPGAIGLECDKMNQQAVEFHIGHIITEIQKHLGDLIGSGFTHVHFDSYEAGEPTWTANMKAEFLKRRGYDLTPYLATFAGRIIDSRDDSLRFKNDFDATIKDLYKDIYYTTLSKKLKAAHLTFLSEPYGGPWRQDDVIPLVHHVMTEFWTEQGVYKPYELEPTVTALRKSEHNLIESEAFTGQPADSKWQENPAWLKPIGDAAFCAGVNRLVLHRFVHQPWDERYKPGNSMGQWGTHFDRTQTWWKPAKAMVTYWQRCQALLQWGSFAEGENDFLVTSNDSIKVKGIHRRMGNTNIYFVANTAREAGRAICSFKVSGMQPELWDPVTATLRTLPQFDVSKGTTSINLAFDRAQSFFVVFRKKLADSAHAQGINFATAKPITTLAGPWKVQFDAAWGGPAKPVVFAALQDWTTNADEGIRYYSGTAIYSNHFDVPGNQWANKKSILYLDLGVVNHIARVFLNGKDLGVVWTAPWRIQMPYSVLKKQDNQLVVEVTNVWANRLIGDEQQPADCEWLPNQYFYNSGAALKEFPDWFLNKQPRPSSKRYCFTTWNYFDKDAPLVPSGLVGPVRIVTEQ